MKTLIVFHRLLKDGNPNFISELRYRSAIFNLRKFADMSSPEGKNLDSYIRIPNNNEPSPRYNADIYIWEFVETKAIANLLLYFLSFI